jgi:DNA-dependent RNA polymerase auxiliary subunit epsilon
MTLTNQVVKNIIKRLVKGEDYRIEVVTLINAEFLQFAIDFFKKVIEAKFANCSDMKFGSSMI